MFDDMAWLTSRQIGHSPVDVGAAEIWARKSALLGRVMLAVLVFRMRRGEWTSIFNLSKLLTTQRQRAVNDCKHAWIRPERVSFASDKMRALEKILRKHTSHKIRR